MSIAIDHSRALAIGNWVCNSSIAETGSKYEGFQWKFRGKLLKDLTNRIGPCNKEYPGDCVFLVDINLLRYNFENRRIKIYLKERVQEKAGSKSISGSLTVSETNKEDVEWLESLLLGKKDIIGVVSNAPGFEQELITSHQLEPAVITRDGTLRNGNRRKAIFHEILRKIAAGVKTAEMNYGKLDPENFKYLKVIILPHDITDDDLFDLENFLQTKKEWKQVYDPISTLMIIKEAYEERHYTFEDIRRKYLHDVSASKIQSDYKKIIAIDKYLTSINKPGQYRLIQNQQEMFEDYVNYDFANTGLASLHKEKAAEKQAITRKRDEFFYDLVSANHYNPEVLRPSEKAVRSIASDVFKSVGKNPSSIIAKFYSGIDRKKLIRGEETMTLRFSTNVASIVDEYKLKKADLAPLEKLKQIALDLNKFSTSARGLLARKRETGKYVKLAKEGLSKIELEVAKHKKED
ncbi:MAG: hypothetical protein HY247_06575 [archaeon]|nr:MAG: hypothetical protein HY247_06575 [archaeon]